MSNESPRERAAARARLDRDRCAEAARRLRHRIVQGQYAGLPATSGDDLSYFAAVLDSAGMALPELPAQVRRDVLAAVGRVLDDGEKLGEVDPLTSGPGH